MKRNINLNRLWYKLKHQYFTLNHAVIAVAALMAIGWAWGSISVMQRNYELQRKLDTKERQLQLVQLEVELAKYQKRYHESNEFKELAARQYLGLANPGESVMFLPPNSQKVLDESKTEQQRQTVAAPELSNIEQWVNFLLGRNTRVAGE